MNYYYKVALMLDKDGIDNIKSNLISLKNNKPYGWSYVNLELVRNSLCHKINLLLNNADKHYIDNKSNIEIRYWEKLDWCSGNTCEDLDIKTIVYLLEKMDPIHYKYISIGENLSDIEIKGSLYKNPFNLNITMTININPMKINSKNSDMQMYGDFWKDPFDTDIIQTIHIEESKKIF